MRLMPVVLVSTLFLTSAFHAGPAAAQDDPLICGSAQSEWRKLNQSSRSELENFLRRIPAECRELRRQAQQALKGLPPPPAGPRPKFKGAGYTAVLDRCSVLRGGAECTLYVTSTRRVSWTFSNATHMVDENGGHIRATEMTVGNDTRSVDEYSGMVYIVKSVRTRIIYRFTGEVVPDRIQALVVLRSGFRFPHTLKPIPWY